jgi:formylglycine-generating enzyme required for sulfatase activity
MLSHPLTRAVLLAAMVLGWSVCRSDPEPAARPTNRPPMTEPADDLGTTETPAPATPPSLDDMVRVPASEFWFGCDRELEDFCYDSRPPRFVWVDEFYIDRTEVTVAAYAECVAAGSCTEPQQQGNNALCDTQERNWGQPGRENHPVNCVDWGQAYQYCVFRGKRLPTAEEWEKAARGIDGRRYPWGEDAPTPELAVMLSDAPDCQSEKVGSRPAGASPYGALDMAGNVEEWTLRSAHEPVRPAGRTLATSNSYEIRGGYYCARPWQVRTYAARGHPEFWTSAWTGFRCVYGPTE